MDQSEHNSHLLNWTFDFTYLTPVSWKHECGVRYSACHIVTNQYLFNWVNKLFMSSLWEQQYLKVQTFKVNISIFCKKAWTNFKITGTFIAVFRNNVLFVVSGYYAKIQYQLTPYYDAWTNVSGMSRCGVSQWGPMSLKGRMKSSV